MGGQAKQLEMGQRAQQIKKAAMYGLLGVGVLFQRALNGRAGKRASWIRASEHSKTLNSWRTVSARAAWPGCGVQTGQMGTGPGREVLMLEFDWLAHARI